MIRSLRSSWVGALFVLALGNGAVSAQTTQALISGRITNSLSGEPIAGATVTCAAPATNTLLTAAANREGFYTLPLLPPGEYQLEVKAEGFQAKAQFEVLLGVASALDLDFALRPLTNLQQPILPRMLMMPGGRSLLNFYGPDVDPNFWTSYSPNPGNSAKLEASISNVVRPDDISTLPLEGNNAYSILLAEPGTSASNSTTRSLGISANGLRPSASSFLLDGLDANFSLISGPLVAVAPEALQEYRLSTNNFSAEYGGTAGYIANAVTRAGGSSWHGEAYFNLENEALDGNGFQDNASSVARRPSKEDRLGYFLGGPLRHDRLFLSLSTDYLRTRDSEPPVSVNLPNSQLLNRAGCPAAHSIACRLLTNYPVPTSTALDPYVAPVTLEPLVALDRWLSVARMDYAPTESVHGTLRAAVSHLSQPDFIWSPYSDYISGLEQPVLSLATRWTLTLSPSSVNELAAGWNDESASWGRAHNEVPTLVAGIGNTLAPLLPGSPAAYGLNNQNRTFEVHDEQVKVWGRHIVKAGGGLLFRHLNDQLNYGSAGLYTFNNAVDFASDIPSFFTTSLSRVPPIYVQPHFDRIYREVQYFFFAQDTFRLSPRFTVNLGLRYDNLGGPVSIGPYRDPAVVLGSGTTVNERVAGAQIIPAGGTSSVYPGANRSFAPRVGFSYALSPGGGTVLRGGFGIFYDRPFDNLWLNARNNSFSFSSVGFDAIGTNYLAPVSSVLPTYSGQPVDTTFPFLTAFQKPMANGYAEDMFLGIQQAVTPHLSFEVNGTGSLGRRLITTDVLNVNSLENPGPPINWIAPQGISDYYALNLVSRWRGRRGFLQAAWTWSHAIDEQSDPLAGDFFNLLFVNPGEAPNSLGLAGFSRPGDSRGDRGNADFDQRQVFVIYGAIYPTVPVGKALGHVLNHWTLSTVAAARSGFPYTIYTNVTDLAVINARARVANPIALHAAPQAYPGGERLFAASAFCPDDSCRFAETGRNAFAGPGLVNLDLSIMRDFSLKYLGDKGTLRLRADFFNALNHANLNPPGNIPGSPNYGIALFGTPQATSGFPALVPLSETARRLQLQIRLAF